MLLMLNTHQMHINMVLSKISSRDLLAQSFDMHPPVHIPYTYYDLCPNYYKQSPTFSHTHTHTHTATCSPSAYALSTPSLTPGNPAHSPTPSHSHSPSPRPRPHPLHHQG